MKKWWMLASAALLLAACSSGPDATCATSTASFSSAQCMAFATAQGCTSGMSQPALGGTVQGCAFNGCPTGRQIQCSLPAAEGSTGDATAD